MPTNFTTPPAGPGAPQGLKSVQIVPLEKAPVHKRETYSALAASRTWQGEASDQKLDIDMPAASEVETESVDVKYTPSDEDKKAFLSAILGGKVYMKKFKIYGNMTITLTDRSVEHTEKLYDVLNSDYRKGKILDEDYDTVYERYLLALQLVRIDNTPYDAIQDEAKFEEWLTVRVSQLMKLSKPVYQAIMEVCRRFEIENRYMTEHAQDSDFWKPGGQA
jgi:hypothetical protein